jgi:hypothetical protein
VLLADAIERPNQFGNGCLSDQLLGQLFAHVTGLGHVLPAEHVRRAAQAIHRHNFRRNLNDHDNLARTYALGDEAGLLICSWPHGGRPRRPFVYADEVWTGIEYGVASLLLYEGLVDEALEIVRAARARHDGTRRSPWSEAEAGHHYARSLASWGLLLAYTGFDYDASRRSIGFTPVVGAADLSSFFSTGSGWGVFRQDARSVELDLRGGTLELSELRLARPEPARVTLRDRELEHAARTAGDRTVLGLSGVTLEPGETLRVEW